MTKLTWGNSGERFYELGVDRGVLYVEGLDGVVWNGLISVSESPDGGEAKPYYIDGYKYLNVSAAEEFEATIEAYSSPEEFDRCDGLDSIHNGLFISQQPRESFGFSYRTKVGNDVDGMEHGYKIHLVYNALASPPERSNESLSDDISPIIFSWDITTLPPYTSDYTPSAHFIIDSRKTPLELLTEIEAMLYGTDNTSPYLPSAYELTNLYAGYTHIELIAETGSDTEGYTYTNEVVRVHKATNPPDLKTGEERMWLDTSGGDFAVLKLVVGD